MDLKSFRESLGGDRPPDELPALLKALWHDGKGQWDRAHMIAQEDESADAAWVHAYLHRKEGDLSNAGYWYRRAGRPVGSDPLEREWENLVKALLEER